MRNIAIILAAGSGSRFGSELPKQFVKIGEKMLLEYALETFQNHPQIDEIIIVVQQQYQSLITDLQQNNVYSKLTTILEGGAERYHSTLSVIRHFAQMNEECNLIFHDAVRPFVSVDTISEVVQTLESYSAVVVAVPTVDTMLTVSNGVISQIPNRSMLWHAQTPQAFRKSTIQQAFELALQDPNFKVTDDGSVVFRYLPEEKIRIVRGEEKNRKITVHDDLILLS